MPYLVTIAIEPETLIYGFQPNRASSQKVLFLSASSNKKDLLAAR